MDGSVRIELVVVFLVGLFLRDLLSCVIKTLKSKNNRNTTKKNFLRQNDKGEIHHILRPVGYIFASNDERNSCNYAATPLQDSSSPIDTA
jgi:hypothetical protein